MNKFTEQERLDIRTSYRQAKNPEKQLSILSELHACSVADIVSVVQDLMDAPKASATRSSNKRKYSNPRHNWSESEIKDLIACRSQGMPLSELANKYNVSVPAIRQKLDKFKHIANESESHASAKDTVTSSGVEVVNLPFISKSSKSSTANSCIELERAISLLKEFQSIVSNVSLNASSDIFIFGKLIGELSCKVSQLLDEVGKDAK